MTREIVLDTETTGLSPLSGDRIVEIGCVELINHIPTGKNYHAYLNPERDMPMEAFNVHGLSEEFLSDKPLFAKEVENFQKFIGDAPLIIHNAPFDMGFLNTELARINIASLTNAVVDTVTLARKVHPGARVSLDALCKHYGVDNSKRTLHGALLDAEILAEIYLELIGGRQVALSLSEKSSQNAGSEEVPIMQKAKAREKPVAINLSEEEKQLHEGLIKTMGKDALWTKIYSSGAD